MFVCWLVSAMDLYVVALPWFPELPSERFVAIVDMGSSCTSVCVGAVSPLASRVVACVSDAGLGGDVFTRRLFEVCCAGLRVPACVSSRPSVPGFLGTRACQCVCVCEGKRLLLDSLTARGGRHASCAMLSSVRVPPAVSGSCSAVL